jgi:ectoine hydroxylase-related dioxygenase (phytanoyl-CoA dioxygenase family)
MSTVRHAVPLEQLRRYPGWQDPEVRGLGSETVLYLHDDLSVHGDFLPGRALFDDASPEWALFCRRELGLESHEWPPFELHPHNRDFRWRPTEGPFRLITEEQARGYDELGWVVIEDAFDPETIAAITAEIDRIEEESEESLRKMRNGKAFIARAGEITFTTHLCRRSALLREFYASKVWQDLMHDLIGPDVRLYWDQAVYKKPGVESPFPWHQDNGYTFLDPQQYVTCWLALTDADETNGCLWLVPAIHRLGTLKHDLTSLGYVCFEETPKQAVPLPARSGTLVAMAATTPHVTGGNMTSETRKALVVQYAPDGSETITTDAWGNDERRPATMPDRQYPILVGGRPPQST